MEAIIICSFYYPWLSGDVWYLGIAGGSSALKWSSSIPPALPFLSNCNETASYSQLIILPLHFFQASNIIGYFAHMPFIAGSHLDTQALQTKAYDAFLSICSMILTARWMTGDLVACPVATPYLRTLSASPVVIPLICDLPASPPLSLHLFTNRQLWWWLHAYLT